MSFTAMIMAATISIADAGSGRTDSLPVGRCVNIGNHLESPTEGAWAGKAIAAEDFQRIAAAGFQTIRLPVRWDSHAGTSPPYAIDPAWLARVEQVVDQALAAGLNVILDSHNFTALHADPAGNRDRLAGLWRQIAARFASRPAARLWFEIENEPHDKLTNANLRETLAPALAAIRRTNPTRPVVIGGDFWSGVDSLATLQLPDDPHVVPTFHYYEPFDFTHQGASWVEKAPPTGRAYGGAADAARLTADVAKVRAYIARTGKTPFIGESGAYEVAPLADRLAYTRAVRDGFAPLRLGVCAWAYTNTFPVYDHKRRRWVPGMLQALGITAQRAALKVGE